MSREGAWYFFWNSGWLMWSLRVLNKIEVVHLFIMWPPVITLTSQYLKKVACPFPRYYYTYLPCEFGGWLDLRLMSECVCRDFGTRSWFSSFISGIKYSMVSMSLRMLYKSTQITQIVLSYWIMVLQQPIATLCYLFTNTLTWFLFVRMAGTDKQILLESKRP